MRPAADELRVLWVVQPPDDLAPILAAAPNVRELHVLAHTALQPLAKLDRLEALTLQVEAGDDLAVLRELKLRRLTLKGPTRSQLEAVVRDHPDLEELAVVAGEIGDPTFLGGLSRPRVLVLLTDRGGIDVTRLAPASGVKLVVLNKDLFKEEPATAQAVRERLPGSLVVPGEGACVGSGWLLLLVPAVGLLAPRLRRRPERPAA